MYLYQYIILIILFTLLFNIKVRGASFVLLTSFFVYYVFVLDLPGEYYYVSAALIELVKGYMLNKRFRVVAYLSYLLIVINFFGWAMYESNAEPYIYDILCSIIAVIQVLTLITRGLIHGSDRPHSHNPLVLLVDFDSRQSCDKMQKTTQTKKTSK